MSEAEGGGTREPDTQSGGGGGTHRHDCFCLGLGPQLTSVLRGVVQAEDVAEHLRVAQLEGLKFLRALIEHRIDRLTAEGRASRGTRLTVE